MPSSILQSGSGGKEENPGLIGGNRLGEGGKKILARRGANYIINKRKCLLEEIIKKPRKRKIWRK